MSLDPSIVPSLTMLLANRSVERGRELWQALVAHSSVVKAPDEALQNVGR